ncbi:MAG: hypothetical protein ABI614_03680 [Planctomycetota bacterium]
MNSEQIRAEQAKRERHWDVGVRWRVLQDAIAWAAAQSTVNRNSVKARLAEQNRKLAWFANYTSTRSKGIPS